MQLAIARSALANVDVATEPGAILPLDHVWPEPWKDDARQLKDHRTERFDTPQYQEPPDREAAIASHGAAATTGPGAGEKRSL